MLTIIRGNSYSVDGIDGRILTYAISTDGQPTDLAHATFALVIAGQTIPIPAPTVANNLITFTIPLTVTQTNALPLGQSVFDITASWGTGTLTSIVHQEIALVE
jgi:hypothetical protein